MTSLFFALGHFGLTTVKMSPSFKMMENNLALPRISLWHRLGWSQDCLCSSVQDWYLLQKCERPLPSDFMFPFFPVWSICCSSCTAPSAWLTTLFCSRENSTGPPVRNSSKNKTTTSLSTHSLHTQRNETQWNPGIPYSQKLSWSQSLVRDAGLNSSSFALEEF